MGEHSPTPTPWETHGFLVMSAKPSIPVAHCSEGSMMSSEGCRFVSHVEARANAAFIAHAVNLHDEMVAALRMVANQTEILDMPKYVIKAVEDALAKASPTPRKVPDPTGSER